MLFSSAGVDSHDDPPLVTESTPVCPATGVYGDTKIAAEQVALQAHGPVRWR